MGLSNNLGKLSNMITSTGSAVGIAQTSPSYTLDVTGTGRYTSDIIVNGHTFGRGGGSAGNNDLAIGANALSSNTTGTNNTAGGNSALGTNTTGSNNTAFGSSSLTPSNGSGNSAFGFNSLGSNTSGSYNTVIGYNSGSAITTGSNNTIVGNYAGTTTMANNIVLADGAGNIRYQWNGTTNNFTGAATFSSSVIATNDTTGAAIKLTGFTNYGTIQDANDVRRIWFENTGSYRTIFDLPASGTSFDWRKNDGTTLMVVKSTGNVGINTGAPSYTLEVQGTTGAFFGYSASSTYFRIRPGAANGTVNLQYGANGGSAPDLIFSSDSNAERMRLTSNGKLEVGGNGLNGRLGVIFGGASLVGLDMKDVDDTINAIFQYYRNSSNTGIGSITRSGGTNAVLFNTTSDYRLKEDFKEIKGLDKISAIKVYDFKWKGFEDRMDGVIAHELQEIIPYAVHGEKDGKEMQGVDYSKLVPILIKSIQELSAKVTALENR